jgi:hypothetical protein
VSFNFLVSNTSTTAQSNVTARVYFTLDGTQAASNYTLEKYWDQSGVATISGPTLATGSTYYFTVSWGTTSLAAGSSWQFNTALHLIDWTTNFNSGNDWFHTGYAVGSLPAAMTSTNYIPAFVSGNVVWGVTP